MLTRARVLLAAVVVTAALGAISLTPTMTDSADAQPQTGLVNVSVGDVTILEDVRINVAAQVVALICGTQVGNIVVLAQGVVQDQEQQTACTTRAGNAVVISPSPAGG